MRTAVDIIIASGFPSIALWGPELIQIYNDRYRDLMGIKHPAGLAQPTSVCWPEVWHINRPIYERVRAGETLTFDDALYPLTRSGKLENAWFTLTYSPLRDDEGDIAGVLVTLFETTERVLAERRLHESEAQLASDLAGLRRLYELNGRLANEPDLRSRMAEIVEAANSFLGTDRGFVQLVDAQGEHLELFAGRGYDQQSPFIRHMREHGPGALIDAARRYGRRLVIEDIANDPALQGKPERALALEEEVLATQATPMMTRDGELVGVLTNQFRTPHKPEEDQLRLIDLLAWSSAELIQRHRTEQALRRSQERQTFLLKLSDALRPLANPRDIQAVAARLLREQFDTGWCYYIEWNAEQTVGVVLEGATREGLASLAGQHDVSDVPAFFEFLRSGQLLVVPDYAGFELLTERIRERYTALGVRAILGAPLVKDGQPVALLLLADDREREWPENALDLVRETAERTWAAVERAKAEAALRDSEAHFRALVTAGTYIIYRMSPDWRSMYQLDGLQFLADTGKAEDNWAEVYLLPEDRPAILATVQEAIRRKSLFEMEHRVRLADGGVGWVISRAVPILGADGEIIEWFGVGNDVTAKRELADRLRDAEAQHRHELERQVVERTAELQASRDLLQATMDSSPDMIQVFRAVRDETGEIVDFHWILNNNTSQSQYGEVRGRSLLQRNPGVVEEGIFDAFKRVTETGVPEQAERYYAHEQFDGWFHQSVVKLEDGVATTTKDITEWKNAQEELLRLHSEIALAKLRQSEERFRLIVESARDYAIFTTDTGGIITEWPAGAQAVFGGTPEMMIGQDVAVTFLPEDIAEGAPDIERRQALERGHAPNVRWHRRADGSRVFIEGSARPLLDGNGSPVGLLKIGQDVTERRRVQRALTESEERLRTLTEGIPQLVWRSAEEGLWTWSSPQWQDFTGQTLDASLGLGWMTAVHPEDRDSAREAWAAASRSGEVDVEFRVRRAADGAYLWHHTRALPVRGRDGAILEWLGTTTDVQQLKQLQERQAVLVAELQHRTRNLIAVVRSIAGQTMASTGPGEAFREEFNHRLEALSRVQGLLSRSDQEPITLEGLIRMELDALGPSGPSDRIVAEGPAVRIRHSAVQTLALALHELATNSRKYGALSREEGRLEVRWSTYDGENGKRLALNWNERGGDPPHAPSVARRGYGRELIERALPYSLNARTSFEHDETGLRCTIDMPLGRTVRGVAS